MIIHSVKKAFRVLYCAGVGRDISIFKLVRNAMPYFVSRAGRSKPPLSVYWVINNVCNMKCRMCDIGVDNIESNFFKNTRGKGEVQEIDIEKYESVLEELVPYHPMLSIVGAEPLLYREIGRAVESAVRRGFEINVTTNGYLLLEKAKELVEAGLTRLTVSIDGPAEIHDEIRGREGCHARAFKGVREARRVSKVLGIKGPEIFINATISNHNYHSLEKLVEAVDRDNVDRINMVYLHFVDAETAARHNAEYGDMYHATVSSMGQGTDPTQIDIEVLERQLATVRRRYGDIVRVLPQFSGQQLSKYFNQPSEFMGRQSCMASWFIAQIGPNGDVIPYTRCYNTVLGNIYQNNFVEIWNGKKMRAWRKDIRRLKRMPACSRCDQVY